MNDKKLKKLEFSGERMVNHPNSILHEVSLERYKFANKYVKDKSVLDIACGSGYGSFFLKKDALDVVGADIDNKTIDYCKDNYKLDNLEFLLIGRENNPYDFRKKFDIIVSFETIEHVGNVNNFITRLKECLKENGIIIISTPNNFRKIYPPENKFHIYEFDIIELCDILKKFFPESRISIFGQGETKFKRFDNLKIAKNKIFFHWLIKVIYDFDMKTFKIINKIEHLNFYKKISRWKSDVDFSKGIYKINPNENFCNPDVSIFLIEKNTDCE